jgi:DNA-directed RNA polymerase sigma subunit (sigma70/sigma32)
VEKVLHVSKERIRQIQDRTLQTLRTTAEQENLVDRLALSL